MKEIASLKKELAEAQLNIKLLQEMNQFQGGFLARSAHELRSPLSSLISLHQMILAGLCENEAEEKEFITHAKDYSLKLLDLLNQLIDISQIEVGQFPLEIKALSVNELFKQINKLVALYAQHRGLRLEIKFLDQDCLIMTDQKLITQVLVMILNRIIALVEEGKILINATLLNQEEQISLQINFPLDLEELTEEIEINSPSFPNDETLNQENLHLDQPQFSLNMTLMMAQKLLRKMGGNLVINSSLNNDPKNNQESNFKQLQCLLPLAID